MPMAIIVPGDIDSIFDEPGASWTPDERLRVVIWLNSKPQLDFLCFQALLHLGFRAQPEDAEDAWNDYCVKRLNRVIDRYNPAYGCRFWNYLLRCFRRFCHDEGRKIGPRPIIEIDAVVGTPLEFEFTNQDEHGDVERAAEQEEKRLAMRACVNKLKKEFRDVVVLRDFQEMSIREVAREIGVSESLIKMRHSRALLMLAKCLRRRFKETETS